MRSIRYICGGKPGCFADCIDYAKNHQLKGVRLELKTYNEITEEIILVRLSGFFTWDFNDLVITYEEQFGGIVETEGAERQEISLLNANRRLERRIKDFEQFNIELTNNEVRFKEMG